MPKGMRVQVPPRARFFPELLTATKVKRLSALTFYVKIRAPLLLAALLPAALFAADSHSNLGLGLKQLVENYQTDQTQFQQKMAEPTVQAETTANRVMVNIHLDGTRVLSDVQTDLANLGLEIVHADSTWRHGVISAWLPIAQANAAAQLAGVRSVMLAPKPHTRVGSVTAESNVVEHTDVVNKPGNFRAQGILGSGISVGIISDSYDHTTPHASAGVASGDLPGPGNPDGYTTPVFVRQDSPTGTDEGRAMAEIVHDLAPAAKICFATAGTSATSFAQNIRELRLSNCDIICDDIYFTDEPFFSDGPIAKAIDDVVASNTLLGKKVVYFSAAGNDGNSGYSSDLHLVSAATGKASAAGTLNFTVNSPPPGTYTQGFHNFNPGGATRIWTKVTTDSTGTATVVLQWDDPFDTNGVTTDYDFLVFDSTGHYLSNLSSTDDNIFGTHEPIEMTNLAANTTYYLVIGLSAYSPSPATHLRFISVGGASISGPDIAYSAISIFGHPTAANANAVGAYKYNTGPDFTPNYNPGMLNPPPGPYRPALEDFSSTGGSIPFYFDANGNRLVNANIRQKPEFCAADGVDTTFFGSDFDHDGFPNFFGTSAAAPTAAAIGALILDAAGGPGSRTADQVRSLMEQSVFPHDLDPNICTATATNGTATVHVTANGNSSNDSATSPTFFTVTFSGNAGETLDQLILDLTNTRLVFDESVSSGFPFTVGSNPSGISVSHTLSPDNRILTLTFGNTFHPGQSISFGIDRDIGALSPPSGGNSADLLAAADIKATVDSSTILLGAFANVLGTGFTFADGYGLLNAQSAIESILGPLPGSSSVAANLSTRAITLTGDNVLIGGFIVQGPSSKNLIIRAIGPSLAGAGVAGPLADPNVELHNQNGAVIAFDDDWQDDPNQATAIQNAGLAPGNPKESALAETLAPGPYTAIVRGTNQTTGVALVEIYDIDSQPAASQLVNISTRAPVQTGDNVMIGGFIITGSDPINVVIRGIGPSLTAYNVAGALPDPFLELHDGNGSLITSNDNWQQDSLQAVQIQAAGLAPGNALESALFMTLNPGAYTAIVKGAQSTTGVGLVEVFKTQ